MTRHSVLIVDDQPTIRDIWARILAKEGFKVARAADAFDALQVLNTSRPSVVVLDVHLPGLSGVWLADVIREKYPTTAIVLASGDPFVPPRDSLRSAVVAYVLKPISRAELVAAVRAGILWSEEKQRPHG